MSNVLKRTNAFKFNKARNYSYVMLAFALSSCAINVGMDESVTLVYPYGNVDYGGIDNIHDVAASVAQYYVKVSVFDGVRGTGIRSTDHGPSLISGASGTVISGSGYVVTAAHIAQDTRHRAQITTIDGGRYDADIVAVDHDGELALLRTTNPINSGISVPYQTNPQRGQAVLAIGTPLSHPGTVTVGRVLTANLRKTFRYGRFVFRDPVMMSMHIEPGYSGGPVFDEQGKWIGMIVGFDLLESDNGDYVSTGIAYAIPASRVHSFVQQRKTVARRQQELGGEHDI